MSRLLSAILAAALAITLATGSLAACGAHRRMSSASSTDLLPSVIADMALHIPTASSRGFWWMFRPVAFPEAPLM